MGTWLHGKVNTVLSAACKAPDMFVQWWRQQSFANHHVHQGS